MRFDNGRKASYIPGMKNKLTAKIFTLTEILIRHGKPMSIQELSRESGIERSACWRIAADLCELGYLRKVSYRTVEPGLGMAFWGQAAYSDAFFPQRAIRKLSAAARELHVSTALAGIFNRQLIYLHRDGCDLHDFYDYPLHGSNLALCILTRKHGGETAYEYISEAAGRFGYSPEQLEQLRKEYRDRIRHMEKMGFALEKTGSGCNISFPVECSGEIFGLAFFFPGHPERDLSELIIRCSLLRNELQK